VKITEQRQGAVVVVRPCGPVVAAEVDQLRKRIMEAIDQSRGRFVLDISEIAYVDSQGLELLLDVHDAVHAGGQVLKLCGRNDTLRQILELTELAPLFEPYEDANMAVRSFL
jgi:anti-anti-sigma factor